MALAALTIDGLSLYARGAESVPEIERLGARRALVLATPEQR